MAIFSRKRKHPQHQGMSRFSAGLIAVVLIAVFSYFGFTKANPFASPYKLKAAFETANNLKKRSPVRIAGVEVGKVTKVEALEGGGAVVEMEIKDKGLPIHKDATVKVRPRIFLEGNFFVDIEPGSPSEEIHQDGDPPIPTTQTSAPVQFADLLASLQTDTRRDLQTFLQEFSKGLEGDGAKGFNDSIRYWEAAYKNGALANQATLGTEPTKDLQRLLKGQQRTFAALAADEEALKNLVTNFNVTAGAFAREDVALQESIPALRDLLRTAQPALASLNDALPSLRLFAREALPGVRSSGPTLRASLPFVKQLRLLVRKSELRGAAKELRRQIPRLVRLNVALEPLLEESRLLSSCTNGVLIPFVNSEIPNPEAGNSNQIVNHQLQRGLVGLSGESRLSDGNNTWFHGSAVPPTTSVRPAPPSDQGRTPPVHRPDVACETQEPPNLNAPGGSVAQFMSKGQKLPKPWKKKNLAEASRILAKAEKLRVKYAKIKDKKQKAKAKKRAAARKKAGK